MDDGTFTRPRTFAGELADRVAEHPDKPFLVFGDEPVTYGEMQRSVRSAANQLLSLGVGPGDTVGILGLASREFVATWLACVEIGAISMPINVMFRGEFLRHQLTDSGACLLLADFLFLPQVAEVIAEVPTLRTLVVRGPLPDDLTLPESVTVHDSGIMSEGATDTVHGGEPHAWNDVACLFYTSGTTGPSKGALLTQQYLCVAAEVLSDAYGIAADDVTYSALPLFHMGGAYTSVVGALVAGRTSVIEPMFSVSTFHDRVRTHGATVFFGVGPMLTMLMSAPDDGADADLPLRLVVGAPIPPGMHEAVEARYGATVMQAFGQTEAIPIALTRVGDESAPGSAGKPGPLHEVRILDDDDHEVAPGAVGEIAIRPRYPHLMFEGYRNRPDATLAQFRNLWYHTGDLGRIDEKGDLWWTDRKKDAIRRRGENISSFEVEQAVLRHPAVAEVAAHGVASDVGEEDVKICVVVQPDEKLDPAELVEHCEAVLPAFMVPRYVELVESLPKNAVGRVQKFVLRDTPNGPDTFDRGA